jgi:hypothetical protein
VVVVPRINPQLALGHRSVIRRAQRIASAVLPTPAMPPISTAQADCSDLLKARSPITHAQDIITPLLVVHGEND